MNIQKLTKYKKVLVLGLGKSCVSAYKFLEKRGYEVLAYDDNPKIREVYSSQNFKMVDLRTVNYLEIDFVVVSPGICLYYPKPHYIIEKQKEFKFKLLCDIELLWLCNNSKNFVGITGTNGKSTTTALTQHLFQVAQKESVMGGNIGFPILDVPNVSDLGLYIIEISSYQIELLHHSRFQYVALLNISEDHIEYHGGFDNYINAKKKLFDNQTKDDYAIISMDDVYAKSIAQSLTKSKVIPISTRQAVEGGIYVINDCLYDNFDNKNKLIVNLANEVKYLRGEHNYQNIATSYAIAKLNKIQSKEIITGLRTFKGLKHRQNLVRSLEHIDFINDSKATNPDSAAVALKTFDNIYWILGGIPKAETLGKCEKYFDKIKYAFLIGKSKALFAKLLEDRIPYIMCRSVQDAVMAAMLATMGLEVKQLDARLDEQTAMQIAFGLPDTFVSNTTLAKATTNLNSCINIDTGNTISHNKINTSMLISNNKVSSSNNSSASIITSDIKAYTPTIGLTNTLANYNSHAEKSNDEVLTSEILSINSIFQKKAVVLFSPAAASFDMFKNFEERGDIFSTIVKSLKFVNIQ